MSTPARTSIVFHLTAVLLAVPMLASLATAVEPPVFTGDPINPTTSRPYVILPGVPLVDPGNDAKFGTNDDIVNTAVTGDVDLVVRTGGTFSGGAIPPPATSVASAPSVIAGGGNLGLGTEVTFQAILSDGAIGVPGGNALAGPDLDGRGVLVLAFADFDGDGTIGPNSADGNLDNELELQEAIAPVARQVALLQNGVGTAAIGIGAGAPPSFGGLGIVLAATAAAGSVAPAYADGPWIATLLPFMPPLDPHDLLGGNIRAPDPNYLVDVELEPEKLYIPAATHPTLGTSYAIPLNGSSVTTDLVRSDAGPAVSAGIGIPIDLGTFVADPAKHLVASAEANSIRLVLESITGAAIADDGPATTQTFFVYASDLLGNPTDAGLSPLSVAIEVGSRLRLVSPNLDGSAQTETLQLTGGSAQPIVVDDAGGSGDSAGSDRITLIVDGRPTTSVLVSVGGSGGSTGTALGGKTRFDRSRVHGQGIAGRDRISATSVFSATTGLDPALNQVTFTVKDGPLVIYSRTLPPGMFTANMTRRTFRYRDPRQVTSGKSSIQLRVSSSNPSMYKLSFRSRNLTLDNLSSSPDSVSQALTIGATTTPATQSCTTNSSDRRTTCVN